MTQSKALAKILSMADFEREAEKRLPRPIFGYVSGACEDCQSLQANRDVFAEYEFISRTLVDVSNRSQQVEIFGKTYSAPFGMAPMGITAMSNTSNPKTHERTATLRRECIVASAHRSNTEVTESSERAAPACPDR